MSTASAVLAALVLVTSASCSRPGGDGKALDVGAAALGAPHDGLRVTVESEMSTSDHRFYLVTEAAGERSLVVVVPAKGEPFPGTAPGAFDRVARAEDAARRVRQLGGERIALWYAVLGGGTCQRPTAAAAHFARVTTRPDEGIDVAYPFLAPDPLGLAVPHTCTIALAPDGRLRSGAARKDPQPPQAHRGWQSDRTAVE